MDETPRHGLIHYSIAYCDAIKENSLYSFFPKELTSYFKDNHFKIQAKGVLNMYQLELVNSGADSTFALVQFFDQKFICSLNAKDNNSLNKLLSNASVQFFSDSVVAIAGLNSNLMTIDFKNPEKTKISVYYADNQAIEESKSCLSIIPGIVTRMIIAHNGNTIVIDAQEIVEQPIEEKEFACPLDYRKTEQEDIQNMLMALLN